MGDQDGDPASAAESEASSSLSSQSLLSRHLFATSNMVTVLEGHISNLQEELRRQDLAFLQDRVDNLEAQRNSIDQDICQLRVLIELLSARVGQSEEQLRVAEALYSQLNRASEQQAALASLFSIALARLSRRVDNIERVLQSNRLD